VPFARKVSQRLKPINASCLKAALEMLLQKSFRRNEQPATPINQNL
jgi:hypothetical protein